MAENLTMEGAVLEPASSYFTGFLASLLAAMSFIIVSEIGDKTFFIAAILSMRHSRLLVLAGAMAANSIVFILTVGLGFVLTVIPEAITQAVSSALFAVFSIQMIREGLKMPPDESEEELEEAEEEIKRRSHQQEDIEGRSSKQGHSHRMTGGLWTAVTSSSFVQAFSLTFTAEWGDRSQIATILLGASQDIMGVIIGGLLGHTISTGFAVVSGHIAAKYISLPKVHIIGGIVFLVFAVTNLVFMDW